MSSEENIQINKDTIRRARARFAPASSRRIEVIHRCILGIIRAKRSTYNPEHYEGQ